MLVVEALALAMVKVLPVNVNSKGANVNAAGALSQIT